MKPPPIDESTLVFRRPGPDDADALAALYNDPAVYPGLMQLPYTDAAYWRQRNAQPSDGTAAQSLTLMARRTLLPELVWVPWSQARPAAWRHQRCGTAPGAAKRARQGGRADGLNSQMA